MFDLPSSSMECSIVAINVPVSDSDISASPELVDYFSPSYGLYFPCLFACLAVLDWMPDVVNGC